MPRGVRITASVRVTAGNNQVVPPGAKTYPGTESPAQPNGLPVPEGVRVRTGRGVEVRFLFRGERCSETVRGLPTVAFVQEIARKRERIQQLIGLGKFGEDEYFEEFPDSPRFRQSVETEKPLTIGEALEDWFQSRKNTFGPNTERDYSRLIRNQLMPLKLPDGLVNDNAYIAPDKRFIPPVEWSKPRHQGGPYRPVNPLDKKMLCHLPICLLNDVIVNAIRNTLLNELSVKRVNNIIAPLRGAVERQVMLKKLVLNPFDLVRPLRSTNVVIDGSKNTEKPSSSPGVKPKSISSLDEPLPVFGEDTFTATEGKPDPFKVDEVMAILSHLDAPMANQAAFSFWTGLRTGETIALRLSDVQLDKDRVFVRRSLSRGVLKTPKTDKYRWVDLLPPAKAALISQIELLGAPDGWVFPNPFTRKRWANSSKIAKRWKRALDKAHVRYRRPYQTRHTYASMMLSAGENIMYVASQMGHADWSMLVQVYGQWLPSGAALQAGELVAKANRDNWQTVLATIATQAKVPFDESDYEPEGADNGCDDDEDEPNL